jgi:hypothetical protein
MDIASSLNNPDRYFKPLAALGGSGRQFYPHFQKVRRGARGGAQTAAHVC